MTVRLRFCGAAGTVTGSSYLIEAPQARFLVDCGMFQGTKTIKELNYGTFPYDPATVDFVLLTHAHIDHSGLLPKLVRRGFKGPIHATAATRDLLAFMLPDSAFIQESEVVRLNERNARRGLAPVAPIYTIGDAEETLTLFRQVDYDRWWTVGPGVRARYWNAGHILGSASIELEVEEARGRIVRILFSGDLGPEHKLFHPDPDGPAGLDHMLCESTYGGRRRADSSPDARRAILRREVEEARRRGGNLLIPAFAVERTQELMLDLTRLFDDGAIPPLPVFIDSPLAIRATEVFARHAGAMLDVDGLADPFRRPNLRFTETVDESKAINRFKGGAIIIAASGMCDAGRIRHHLKHNLWKSEATVLLVGYQADGTLGRILLDGAPAVTIHGDEVQVKAAIRQIDAYSGHADGDDLLAWAAARRPVRGTMFLTHGEPEQLAAFRAELIAAGFPAPRVVIPAIDDAFELAAAEAEPRRPAAPRRLEPAAAHGPDWHNDLARFSLALRNQLEHEADDRRRRDLLARLTRLLGGAEGSRPRRGRPRPAAGA
jgi:metallo-beta-lactamase family protein